VLRRSCELKILLLHNLYREPGGEDSVVMQEKALLEARGHEVEMFCASNSAFSGALRTALVACGTVYSRSSRARVEQTISRFAPDLVHVHNFFPQLSPSIYYACRTAQVPVVQTLHNFRLICPNALLFRNGKPCERCIGTSFAWPGVVHACYRNSHVGTTVVAAMLGAHRISNTWNSAVHAFISLSNFARNRFIAGGLPKSRLFVKPNFVMPDPSVGPRSGGYALFVGRLSTEKGLETLLSAWTQLKGRTLKIVGDGPLRGLVEKAASRDIEFTGRQPAHKVLEFLGAAEFLVVPSECYENFPRVIVEAFAKGVPVLGGDLGSVRELIESGRTGLLFSAGDPKDLAAKAEWLFDHRDELQTMSVGARRAYEMNYTADRNYEQLMKIYDSAITTSRGALPISQVS
jgi:glycosyltransferase involved in cell wall biosynthesis